MLKASARNWTPSRSLNVKFLKTERSQFLKPGSRNRLRPIVPKVPAFGGVITEFPDTKHPPTARVLGSAAAAVHFDHSLVTGKAPFRLTTLQSVGPGPVQKGIELFPLTKSLGFPVKSQRSLFSETPLKLFPVSITVHGWPV